ncbi:MAG: cohesin domain-containing protein [Candidatus Bathyarchaeia archaeon]
MKAKLLLSIMLALSLAIAVTVPSIKCQFQITQSPESTKIYMDPSEIILYTDSVSVGYLFNITFWIQDVTDLAAWQVQMTFNDSIINATRWFEPTWDNQYVFYGKTTMAAPSDQPHPDGGYYLTTYFHTPPNEGKITVGTNRFPAPSPGQGFSGTGKLAIVEFNVLAVPTEPGKFSCDLIIDNPNTYALNSTGSEISATKEDGYYEVNYGSPPTLPWLEASPSEYTAGTFEPFKVDIVLKNATASQALIGAQFWVAYNATYLEVIDATEGPFLKDSRWAVHGTLFYWRVDVNVTGWPMNEARVSMVDFILPNVTTGEYDLPEYPDGEGVIATLTFRALKHEAVAFNISILPIFDQFFLDKFGEWIPYAEAHHCMYTYAPLPKPLLSVEPSVYTAKMRDETFEVNVDISNLDVGWKLTDAEFKLGYDSDLLQLVNVEEGSFLKSFGATVFTYENVTSEEAYVKVNMSLVSITEYPSGTGTLATLTFKTKLNIGSCPLSLYNTTLLYNGTAEGFGMVNILHDVESGTYDFPYETLIHEITITEGTYFIQTVSNGIIDPYPLVFDRAHRLLAFNVTGVSGTTGFVNITIPKDLLNATDSDWLIIVGGLPVIPTVQSNSTHTILTFNFNFSTKSVYIIGTWVIPEIPSKIILIFMTATLTIASMVLVLRKGRKEFLCRISQY